MNDTEVTLERVAAEIEANKTLFSALSTPKKRYVADAFPQSRDESSRYGMYRDVAGLRKSVQRCLRMLRPRKSEFDALYVTGNSGTVPGAVVAHSMMKELVVLRKQYGNVGTLSHGLEVEGSAQWEHARLMIVDDFISSGSTLVRLMERMPGSCTLAGIMLYGHPICKFERENGYVKEFVFTANSMCFKKGVYRVVRRNTRSMLCDLVWIQ